MTNRGLDHQTILEAVDSFIMTHTETTSAPNAAVRGEALRRAFWAVVAAMDADGAVSGAFLDQPPANSPTALKRQQLEATARFLLEANTALSPGYLTRGAGGVAGHVIGTLQGRKTDPLLPQVSRQGKRPRSVLSEGAFTHFALLVYFTAGSKGVALPDAFMEIAPDRSYEGFQSTRKGIVRTERCRLLRNAGKLFAAGKPIPREAEADVQRCIHFRDNFAARRELVLSAYRE